MFFIDAISQQCFIPILRKCQNFLKSDTKLYVLLHVKQPKPGIQGRSVKGNSVKFGQVLPISTSHCLFLPMRDLPENGSSLRTDDLFSGSSLVKV